MHTSQFGNTTFIHHGDYSGDISIIGGVPEGLGGKKGEVVVTIEELVQFVASALRGKVIRVVEDADMNDLIKVSAVLNIKFPGGGK